MRVLLTGGRAPVTLDLLRTLSRAGHSVFLAESMSGSLAESSNYVTRTFHVPSPRYQPGKYAAVMTEIIRRESIDLLIPTCEEAFYVSRFKGEFPPSCRTLVDDFQKMRQVHSKFEFQRLVESLGFYAPETFRVFSRSELEDRVSRMLKSRRKVVLKPEFSRFASRARILSSSPSQDIQPTPSEPWIVQEFIEGREWCTYSLAIEGRLVAHSTYDHEFTAGRGAGICFKEQADRACEEWVERFAQRTSWTGQLAFDFMITREGRIYPLECNPRSTSGLHLLLSQPKLIEQLENFSEGRPLLAGTVVPRKGSCAMLGLAMLVYGPMQWTCLSKPLRWLFVFFSSRDVIFDRLDPMPFFAQFTTSIRLAWKSLFCEKTAIELSTADIEWNGGRIE